MPKVRKSNRMEVEGVGFLLDRMGRDCGEDQQLRELTKNAMEAIDRAGHKEGIIYWMVDESNLWGPNKLCIIDNGDGMTGEQLEKLINRLSASGSEQAMNGNYGVGAKIAASTKNPAGVVYLTWKDETATLARLVRDSSGYYGFADLDNIEGIEDFPAAKRAVVTVDQEIPRKISHLKTGLPITSGTKVVLLGDNDDFSSNTCVPRSGAAGQWVRRYLNTRFFLIPEHINIFCQEFTTLDADGNHVYRYQRVVRGQGYMLDTRITILLS